MSYSIHGATLIGIDAEPVEVEVKLQRGVMGKFLLSGLPDAAVRESRERVKCAAIASGLRFPRQTLLAHFAPGDVKKEGNLLDLPLALAVLGASGQIPVPRCSRVLAVGELALDGRVRNVRGLLPIAVAARRLGVEAMIAPAEGAPQAALVEGLLVIPVQTLLEAVAWLSGHLAIPPAAAETVATDSEAVEDFADVRGQEEAKLAVAVAASGLHNLLFIGPPGSGKTMLARRLRSLLPPLDREQALECTRIASVTSPRRVPLHQRPPFRAPHHTASSIALIGGGPKLRPGEITLAHHGVLFLDELPEFDRNALEALRQPLEERMVAISRAAGTAVMPADFCLVAAMNPCPCGYRGSPKVACRCSDVMIRRYSDRLSGPLLDRIDLTVEVPAIDPERLLGASVETTTTDLIERIAKARAMQAQRFSTAGSRTRANGRMTGAEVEKFCALDAASRRLVIKTAEAQRLSARAIVRALRVARTVADLRGAESVSSEDVAVALAWRCRITKEDV